LKRLCVGSRPDDWDECLTDKQKIVCEKLQKELDERGDPVGGIWKFNPDDPWILYTDSSSIAYGTVLQIGEVVVEDYTKLRKKGDLKHINSSELIAVEIWRDTNQVY